MSELHEFLSAAADAVNAELDRRVPAAEGAAGELREAMRWSLFGGGKRFRPALVLAVGEELGAERGRLVGTAAAIEMIHTYSLIHDDLPAMDNDDLRRGRETCHKKFGDATAILAGDALQALAFETIAEDEGLDAAVRIDLLKGLGEAAAAMVAGQFLDLEAEGKTISRDDLEAMHRQKTGALIEYSAASGALIAGARKEVVTGVREYGRAVGLLFQVVDDILDVTQPTEELGKTAGKDAISAKATYPAVMGLEGATDYAAEISETAKAALLKIGVSGGPLAAIPEYLVRRKN